MLAQEVFPETSRCDHGIDRQADLARRPHARQHDARGRKLDRIRNARHFAPRLQRWLSEVGTLIRASTQQQDMKQPKLNGPQLELFAQDFFAALEPATKPAPTQPLFKAPPAPPKITLPAPP